MSNYVIPVSFKENEKWLYDMIKNKSSSSAYIKDILKQYAQNDDSNENINSKSKEITTQNINSLLNF